MNNRIENKTQILHFGGYFATGGSALRDFLYSYSEISIFPSEFRLLKEKNGLLDLENALFISKSPDNIDLAIKDFVILSKNLARITTKLTRKGHSYDKYTDNNFSMSIDQFLKEITDYEYQLFTHNYDYRKSYFKSQLDRYLSKIFSYSFLEKKALMSYPDFNKYIKSAKKLLKSILIAAYEKSKVNSKPKYFGLHNSCPHFTLESISNSKKYFDDFKMILIDRDPRDIFLDFPHNRYLPSFNNPLVKARSFVHFFKSLRKEIKEIKKLDYCLHLSFEDLILNNEKVKIKIEKFLQINDYSIMDNKFYPDKSIKNLQKYLNESPIYLDAIKYIESELKEFLYF